MNYISNLTDCLREHTSTIDALAAEQGVTPAAINRSITRGARTPLPVPRALRYPLAAVAPLAPQASAPSRPIITAGDLTAILGEFLSLTVTLDEASSMLGMSKNGTKKALARVGAEPIDIFRTRRFASKAVAA